MKKDKKIDANIELALLSYLLYLGKPEKNYFALHVLKLL